MRCNACGDDRLIAPRVSSELIPPSGPPFDASVIAETARIHERAGFDRVLIGYFSDAPYGFLLGRTPPQ
jgi:alkanesulfonate monooxygenase